MSDHPDLSALFPVTPPPPLLEPPTIEQTIFTSAVTETQRQRLAWALLAQKHLDNYITSEDPAVQVDEATRWLYCARRFEEIA